MVLYFLWDVFGFASDLSAQVASLGLNALNWPVFIAYFALVNPWIEEYFWRGWLGSESKSLHTSDFLYAGFHGLILVNKVVTGSIIFGLSVLIVAGWFWRQVAREDGGLLTPVIGHMAADFTILVAVYRMVT
jgi:membrane protease YdiL (CAAX protease family)